MKDQNEKDLASLKKNKEETVQELKEIADKEIQKIMKRLQ